MDRRWDKTRSLGVITLLVLLLCAAMLLGLGFGAVDIAPAEVLGSVSRGIRGTAQGTGDALILDIRLPRVLLAALVGACLAAAGTVYQALFRNPLADPYIIGISSGAGLGATVALVLGAGITVGRLTAVPLAAFVGAALTLALVVGISSRRGSLDTTSLLLAGVAVSYTLAALTSFLMVLSRETMQAIVFWMMGGLQGSSWEYVWTIAPMFVLGLVPLLVASRDLNVMLLGDERAGQLGVRVERLKYISLGAASLLVAAAVSVSGLIGFVGLMTPHMVRLVLGPDHRLLLPAATLGGAIVLVLADLLARIVLAPIEIPVGIVTAIAGGPFFIWLLVRGRSSR